MFVYSVGGATYATLDPPGATGEFTLGNVRRSRRITELTNHLTNTVDPARVSCHAAVRTSHNARMLRIDTNCPDEVAGRDFAVGDQFRITERSLLLFELQAGGC